MEKKVTSAYSFDELIRAMTLAPVFRGLKKFSVLGYVFAGFGVLFMAMGLLTSDLRDVFWCGLVVLLLSLVLIFIGFLERPAVRTKLFEKKNRKANKAFERGLTYDYIFTQEGFTVETVSENVNSRVTVRYADLERVDTDADNVYFFLNKVNAYICKRPLLSQEEWAPILKAAEDAKKVKKKKKE